ncbi:hypothetical protein COK43_02600 [Bacillus cereus]|nr:hypothetical protein COK43_02600 [Bacillus cereus]
MFYGLFIITLGTVLTYYIWKIIFKNFIVLDSFIGILGSILGTWFITFIIISAHPVFSLVLLAFIILFKILRPQKK